MRKAALVPVLALLLFGGACGSSGSGSDGPCSEVCDCVGRELGSSAKSSCRDECSSDLTRSDCEAQLDANGAGVCRAECSAFPSGAGGSSGSSGSGGSSGSTGGSGVSCRTSSTGCECSVSSTRNTFECSSSSVTDGTCCASTGWPESGTCACNEPAGACGLGSGDANLGFTCRCDFTPPIEAYATQKSICTPGTGYCCTFNRTCACYANASGDCASIGGTPVSACTPDMFPQPCAAGRVEVSSCSVSGL